MVEEAEMAQIMTATTKDLLEIILCVHRRTAVMMASRSARRATTKTATGLLEIILCVHRRTAVMMASRSARRAPTKTQMVKMTATTTKTVKMTATTTTTAITLSSGGKGKEGERKFSGKFSLKTRR